MASFARSYLDGVLQAASGIDTDAVDRAIDVLRTARDNGRTIYSCGNGGAGNIASQMIADIVKSASHGRKKRFRMMSLCDPIGTITAYANDMSFDCVFEEQLRNWLEPDDVVIGISGSGNSENVIRAVEYANSHGAMTIGCTSAEGGRLKDAVQLPLLVPSKHMGYLEDSFFITTHIICYALIGDQ